MLSRLVSNKMLADIAYALGFETCVCAVHDRAMEGKKKILGDAFEAFVGALMLDQGYDACRAFLEKVMFPRVDALKKNLQCAKSLLQQRSLWEANVNPVYRTLNECADLHDIKEFHVEVSIKGIPITVGKGCSQKEAEENAAEIALWEYRGSG